jgi:hypothetical protein
MAHVLLVVSRDILAFNEGGRRGRRRRVWQSTLRP